MDQRAFFAVARDDVGTVITAFERVLACIQDQLTFGLFRVVTLEAGFFEDGLDVFGEINRTIFRWWELRNINLRSRDCEGEC